MNGNREVARQPGVLVTGSRSLYIRICMVREEKSSQRSRYSVLCDLGHLHSIGLLDNEQPETMSTLQRTTLITRT